MPSHYPYGRDFALVDEGEIIELTSLLCSVMGIERVIFRSAASLEGLYCVVGLKFQVLC